MWLIATSINIQNTMTEVATFPKIPKGFPVGIFTDLDKRFLCSICKQVLKSTVQGLCGHRFCKDCIDYQLRFFVLFLMASLMHCINVETGGQKRMSTDQRHSSNYLILYKQTIYCPKVCMQDMDDKLLLLRDYRKILFFKLNYRTRQVRREAKT